MSLIILPINSTTPPIIDETTVNPEEEGEGEGEGSLTLVRLPIYWYIAIANDICLIFELMFIIFFVSQYFKKNETWSSVYYVLLTIGYIVAFIFQFFYLMLDIFPSVDVIRYMAFSFDWYFIFFNGVWNFLIGCYRSTAVGVPLKHDRVSHPELEALVEGSLETIPPLGRLILWRQRALQQRSRFWKEKARVWLTFLNCLLTKFPRR